MSENLTCWSSTWSDEGSCGTGVHWLKILQFASWKKNACRTARQEGTGWKYWHAFFPRKHEPCGIATRESTGRMFFTYSYSVWFVLMFSDLLLVHSTMYVVHLSKMWLISDIHQNTLCMKHRKVPKHIIWLRCLFMYVPLFQTWGSRSSLSSFYYVYMRSFTTFMISN